MQLGAFDEWVHFNLLGEIQFFSTHNYGCNLATLFFNRLQPNYPIFSTLIIRVASYVPF